jgi:predicted negative regulator of RcsB-dependent stress response
MSLWNQRGQTGIAVLALIIALVALGFSVYTYEYMSQRQELRGQLTKMQELVERGRQEMADALKRLEEQLRGSQPGTQPARQ